MEFGKPPTDEGRCRGRGRSALVGYSATQGFRAVPRWLGWLAGGTLLLLYTVSIVLLLVPYIIWLAVLSYWAYRRGRRDGMGHKLGDEPDPKFVRKVVGWGLVSLVPVLGWYAFVHLPTLCYKQGRNVGAKEGSASRRFTSLPALSTPMALTFVVTLFFFLFLLLAMITMAGPNFGTAFRYEQEAEQLLREGREDEAAEKYLAQATSIGIGMPFARLSKLTLLSCGSRRTRWPHTKAAATLISTCPNTILPRRTFSAPSIWTPIWRQPITTGGSPEPCWAILRGPWLTWTWLSLVPMIPTIGLKTPLKICRSLNSLLMTPILLLS